MAGPLTLYQTGVHGSRPAASAGCVLYSCTDHSLIYKSDGASWTTFLTIPTGASVATDVIFDAAGDIPVGTGADTSAKLSIGTSGQALTSNGTTAVWGRPKGALVDFGFAKLTSGDITCNNTSWTTTGIATLVLTAASGDIIEVGVSVEWGNQATNIGLDAATIVSASPVNWIGSAGGASDLGVQAWLGLTGVGSSCGGSIMYTLQSGDISSSTVTLQLYYRTTSGTNKTLRASTTQPFHWYAKNLGPAI